ncbi:Clavaminate synthase-like protein [Hysterangium stoloniferum]|nr:Clavaminate synthase-like protein [Hysterangium stoloniferum]
MEPAIIQGDASRIAILKEIPSYAQFLQDHLQDNKPCLICPNLISEWPAISLWTETRDASFSGSEVSLRWDYLLEHYGDEIVTVAKCGSRSFSDQERTEHPLREVIGLWKSGLGKDLYVKDWHLAKSEHQKGKPPFYETPDIFRDDWMNAFWEQEGKDDFRFVYMGPAGTFTPLHRDVYTSYSWSTNVTGVKLWHLFPPTVSHHLRRYPDRTTSEIVYDVRDVDLRTFKGFEKALQEILVVEQPPGWTIFVPSGWYHQVENLTDTVSINHNWCNINNLPSIYKSLLSATADVKYALSDVHELLRTRSDNPNWEREWSDIVQDVLKKDSGWDWVTFWRMVHFNMGQSYDNPLVFLYFTTFSTLSNEIELFKVVNPAWPLTPPSFRPPLPQMRAIINNLLSDFKSEWSSDIAQNVQLSTVLEAISNMPE